MDDEVIELIELRGLSQSGCDLGRRLKRMDNGIRLAGKSRQAIDASVCPNIKNNFGFLGSLGPTIKDLLFQEISPEEVKLSSQHLGQIAWHL
jgi:hypothetical protein